MSNQNETDAQEKKSLSTKNKQLIASIITVLASIPFLLLFLFLAKWLTSSLVTTVASSDEINPADIPPDEKAKISLNNLTFITDPTLEAEEVGGVVSNYNINHFRVRTDIEIQYRKTCAHCKGLEKKLTNGKPRIHILIKRALAFIPWEQLKTYKSRKIVCENLKKLLNDYLLVKYKDGERISGYVEEPVLSVSFGNFNPTVVRILFHP